MAHPRKKRLSDNPITVAGIVGGGTLAVTALAVALIETPTGDVVASGPETENVEMASAEMAETDPSAEPVVETSGENVTPEDTADEVSPTVATDATAEGMGASDAAREDVEAVDDGEEPALRGAGDDDSPVGDAAPINEARDDDQSDEEASAPASAEADAAPDAAPEVDEDTSSDLDTSLVVDNDGGEPNEPDGGAAPFVPTPSGPEGRDGDPFSTE